MDANTNANKDLGSVLAHVETLQKQLAAKEAELNSTKQKEEEARQQAAQLSAINSKLTESKREAMKEDFNSKVRDWVRGLDPKQVPDTLKDEFLTNCEKFAEKGDDTGVWKVGSFYIFWFVFPIQILTRASQVVCCASAVHQNQINTIQKLTEDYNTLKKSMDEGNFKTEESRKRKEMEPTSSGMAPSLNVWEQLESMCKTY